MQKPRVLQANDTRIKGYHYYAAGWNSKVCNELRTNEADNLKTTTCLRPKVTSSKKYTACCHPVLLTFFKQTKEMCCIAASQY